MSLVWYRKGIPFGHNPPDFPGSTSEIRLVVATVLGGRQYALSITTQPMRNGTPSPFVTQPSLRRIYYGLTGGIPKGGGFAEAPP